MRALLVLLTLSVQAQTLTLRDALDLAAQQNPSIEIARLRELERRAETEAVKSGYRPQANLIVAGAYQTNNLQGVGLLFPGVPSRIGPFRTFNARPVVTQAVIDLSLLEQIRAARSEAAAAKFDIEVAREETQAAVIALYLQTFQAQSRLRAAEARRASADALVQQVKDREAGGAASQLDVARQTQQRQSEELAVIAAQQDVRLLKPALEELLGSEIRAALVEPTLSEVAVNGDRPDVDAQRVRAEAARHELARAERERWPRLNATGDWGVLGAGPDRATATYSVGASLMIPLWTGKRIESNIEAARLRVQQREQGVRRLQLAATRQAEQAQITHQEQTRAAVAAHEAAEAARSAVELSRLRYEAGLATSVDTVTAQAALAQAEETEIGARYEAQMALARLAFARGDVRAAVR